MRTKKPTSVALSGDVVTRLKAISVVDGRSVSELVENACREAYLNGP